jgi:CheY-specific phosphatase CheX
MDTARMMTESLLRRKPKNQEEITAMAAEFANVVSGMAVSMVNKKDKDYKLRVSPPNVFFGPATEIVSPNISLNGFSTATKFGQIDMSVGFKKGSVLWM